jgi:DNA end-binding protein Ku
LNTIVRDGKRSSNLRRKSFFRLLIPHEPSSQSLSRLLISYYVPLYVFEPRRINMLNTISKCIAGAVESAFADTVNPRGRPSWSGVLRISFVTVPIKAYAAQRGGPAVAFNQIHVNCGKRIQYQKRCPVHGAVDAAEITHGFQYAPDQYVLIEPDERDKSRPVKDKTLVLEQFIPSHQVDPVFFAGRSLYLLPDGVAPRHSYAVLAEAMQNANKWALGKVVLSALRQLVLVRPQEKVLVMDVLHYPRQVHAAANYSAELGASGASAEELRLIRKLVDSASGPVDWSRYRDDRAEELTALIDAKIAEQPAMATANGAVGAVQLLDALKESVAAAQKGAAQANSRVQQPRSKRRTIE